MQTLHYIVYFAFIVTISLTVYYSIAHRRQKSVKKRGLYAARMNINMGLMLVCIALIQTLLFSGSTVRVVFGAVCLVLGLFNVFAGIRNHSVYARMKQD